MGESDEIVRVGLIVSIEELVCVYKIRSVSSFCE